MPNVSTLIAGGGGGGGFFGSDPFGSILNAAPAILAALGIGAGGNGGGGGGGGGSLPPIAQPGGAPVGGAQPVGMTSDLMRLATGATCITPTAGAARLRLPSRVDVPVTDASGNMRFVTFKNVGRPILWTGDLAIAKRVKKISGRLGRSRGGR